MAPETKKERRRRRGRGRWSRRGAQSVSPFLYPWCRRPSRESSYCAIERDLRRYKPRRGPNGTDEDATCGRNRRGMTAGAGAETAVSAVFCMGKQSEAAGAGAGAGAGPSQHLRRRRRGRSLRSRRRRRRGIASRRRWAQRCLPPTKPKTPGWCTDPRPTIWTLTHTPAAAPPRMTRWGRRRACCARASRSR